MKNEFDLVNELGPANWLDAVAGEAVLLGALLRDPEVEILGKELAKMISEIRFDDDHFSEVEAFAKGLEKELAKKLEEREHTVFIDSVRQSEQERWPTRVWEYDLLHLKRYQVWLNLPVYDNPTDLEDDEKKKAEEAVRQCFSDPSFGSYQKTVTRVVNQGQLFITTLYHDSKGKLLRKIVNHEHADSLTAKGWLEKFYFDDFVTAMEAWRGVRKATADRKK